MNRPRGATNDPRDLETVLLRVGSYAEHGGQGEELNVVFAVNVRRKALPDLIRTLHSDGEVDVVSHPRGNAAPAEGSTPADGDLVPRSEGVWLAFRLPGGIRVAVRAARSVNTVKSLLTYYKTNPLQWWTGALLTIPEGITWGLKKGLSWQQFEGVEALTAAIGSLNVYKGAWGEVCGFIEKLILAPIFLPLGKSLKTIDSPTARWFSNAALMFFISYAYATLVSGHTDAERMKFWILIRDLLLAQSSLVYFLREPIYRASREGVKELNKVARSSYDALIFVVMALKNGFVRIDTLNGEVDALISKLQIAMGTSDTPVAPPDWYFHPLITDKIYIGHYYDVSAIAIATVFLAMITFRYNAVTERLNASPRAQAFHNYWLPRSKLLIETLFQRAIHSLGQLVGSFHRGSASDVQQDLLPTFAREFQERARQLAEAEAGMEDVLVRAEAAGQSIEAVTRLAESNLDEELARVTREAESDNQPHLLPTIPAIRSCLESL